MQDEMNTSSSTETTSVAIEQLTADPELIDKVRSIGFGTLTEFQSLVIPLVSAGRDVVAEGCRRGRTLAYLVPLAILKEKVEKARTLIVTDTEADAERIARNAFELGLASTKIGGRQKGPKNQLLSATVISGTTQGFLDAFDEGTIDGAKIRRVVLDGTESAIQSGRTEELLNLLHDLPSTQIVVLRKDSSATIANFIKKFLKTPAEVQVTESAELSEPEPAPAAASEDRAAVNTQEAAGSPASAPPTAAPVKQKKAPANAEHYCIELNNELAAKPNALCDLIDAQDTGATVVFCNSPSDADLTEVMLRKRGISARKLIGFVPPAKVESSTAALESGEASALVVTDISARDMTVRNVGLLVNYSIHTDPDIYLQRTAIAEEGSTPLKVVSLVSPIDIPNFFNLKKLLGLAINKIELPNKDEILKKKVHALGVKAQENAALHDERIKALAALVSQDEHKDDLLALLVHNTFDVLPAALAESARAKEAPEREEFFDGGHRGDRYERGARRDRRGRRGSRDFEGGEGYDSYHDGGVGYGGSSYESEDAAQNSEGGRGRRRHTDDDFEPRVPPARDIRLYIGHGANDGLDQAGVVQLITSTCRLTPEQVKRAISRALYSFVDVPETMADGVVAALSEATLPSGAKVFVKRAVTITSPREGRPESEENSDPLDHENENVQDLGEETQPHEESAP